MAAERVPKLDIQRFADDDLDEAARLLGERHRAHRASIPALDPSFEDAAVARGAIEALVHAEEASGSSVRLGGRLVGYLIGVRLDDAVWGPNAWVEPAGFAVVEPELIRDLYGHAAAGWVDAGRTAHYAVVPATDPAQVDAWFRLGFGHQHVLAIRDAPVEGEHVATASGLEVRRARLEDVDDVARLDLVLPTHQALAPVFSRLPVPTVEDARKAWEEGWDDPRFATFLVEHRGRVVGSAVGCAVDASSMHRGLTRPPGAGFLAFAAVLPEARGLGAGRALGEAVLEWARSEGHATVVADWRMTNLLASRSWPRLGFRPSFYRLHRSVA